MEKMKTQHNKSNNYQKNINCSGVGNPSKKTKSNYTSNSSYYDSGYYNCRVDYGGGGNCDL